MTLAAKQSALSESHETLLKPLRSAGDVQQRYLTLDALRGIAALAVVVVHIPTLFGLPHQVSSGLAVDLFFILSGFVIEHAYGRQLRREMTFSRFIAVRMIRLYPLYIVGIASYALFYFARPNVDATSMVPGVLLALLYLPTPPSFSFDPTFLFPVNPVSWSLFCELFVNILYALFMVRLSARSLLPIIVVFGIALLFEKTYLQAAIDTFGPWSVLFDGVPRALFSFFAGVLINRLSPHRSYTGSPIVILALIAIFALNFGKQFQTIYELIVILIAFPALLFYASSTSVKRSAIQIYALLGAISYPMYVIHMPVVLWVSASFPRVFGRGLITIAPWGGLAMISLIALVSYLLDRAYDEPVRRWLRQRTLNLRAVAVRFEDVTDAIGYAWKKKVTEPRRLRDWQSRTLPFVYTTPHRLTFQLYPDQSIDKCIYVDGAYELRFLQVVERFFRGKPGAVMLDIGANIGNHAVYLSSSFGRVICFEPSPYIAERLEKNIALNRLTNVEVHTVGLSNREATLHYKLDNSGNLGASHFLSEPDEQTIELPVCRGDDYLSRNGVNKVDFIKVDVEHHELEVFEGLKLTVSRCRPIIAFEFHGTSQGSSYLDAIADALPNYIFSEATFAPSSASNLEKLFWQVRHRGLPKFERIVVPEARFYENVIAFPDERAFQEFAASNKVK